MGRTADAVQEVSGMFSTLLVLAGIGAAATVPFLMIVWLARQ